MMQPINNELLHYWRDPKIINFSPSIFSHGWNPIMHYGYSLLKYAFSCNLIFERRCSSMLDIFEKYYILIEMIVCDTYDLHTKIYEY